LLLYKIAPCVSVLEAGPPHLVIGFAPGIGPIIGEDALALHTELVVLAQPEDQIFIVFIWKGCKTQYRTHRQGVALEADRDPLARFDVDGVKAKYSA
jgi:hypothetical protein